MYFCIQPTERYDYEIPFLTVFSDLKHTFRCLHSEIYAEIYNLSCNKNLFHK